MAKLITRTFISTEATLDGIMLTENGRTIETEKYIINATFASIKECQKYIDKHYNGKLVHPYVSAIGNIEELRGITPDAFYANSIKLDPVTRKPIDATEDVEIEEAQD